MGGSPGEYLGPCLGVGERWVHELTFLCLHSSHLGITSAMVLLGASDLTEWARPAVSSADETADERAGGGGEGAMTPGPHRREGRRSGRLGEASTNYEKRDMI